MMNERQADAALDLQFGCEWIYLNRREKRLVLNDFLDALIAEDCSVMEYARRIGMGNLASYAKTLTVQARDVII